jgi:hypothetical protein
LLQIATTIVSWILLAIFFTTIATFLIVSTGLVAASVIDDWFWGPVVVDGLLYNRETKTMGLLPAMLLNAMLLRLAVHFVFSLDSTSHGVNRLGLFHLVDVIQYLVHAINAIFSVLIRLLLGLIGQAVSLGRMDHSLLSGYLMKYDALHQIYLDYLHVELYHTHPVFLTALYFILLRPRSASFVSYDDLDQSKEEDGLLVSDDMPFKASVGSGVTRNRWMLAITLTNNPQLRDQRKHVLFQRAANESEQLWQQEGAEADYVLFRDVKQPPTESTL